jgi:tetratricopeptide (TPR) repeat protein
LVDQSLIQPRAGQEGVPRFTMLETLREYALDRLVESGERETLRERHARYFRARAAPIALLHEVERAALDADYDNLRAVLEWARATGEVGTGLEVTCALIDYWASHGATGERQHWLEVFLDQSTVSQGATDGRSIALRVHALWEAGEVARQLGQVPRAVALFQHSRDLARQHGDDRGVAWAVLHLGIAMWFMGDQAGGIELLEEALRMFQAVSDEYGIGASLCSLARLAYARTDPTRATAYLEVGLAVYRASGDRMGIGAHLQALAEVAILQGQSQRAIALLEECVAVSRDRGERRWVGEALHHLARLVLDEGDWPRAAALLRESLDLERRIDAAAAARRFLEDSIGVAMARGAWAAAAGLLGAVETAREQSAPNTQSVVQTPYVGRVDEVRGHLGASAFAAAWAEGRAMAVEQAVAYALEQVS